MKHNKTKHISTYLEFNNKLNEQEVDPMAAMGGAPPLAPKETIHSFIFLNHPTKHRVKNYENGGYTARYVSYEIGDTELDEWLNREFKEKTEYNKNCSQDDIFDAITGEKFSLSKDERKFMDRFRKAVVIGKKADPSIEIDVEFDKNKVPYTDSLECTFLDTINK